MARPGRWLAVLAVGAALVVVPAAAPAEAHNVLRTTAPSGGESLATAPEEVVLTFDQPALALGTELVVSAPDGRDVADGAPRLVDAAVHQRIAGTLPAGGYTVDWRVTSADGHPVSGTFRFTTTQATSREATAPPAGESTPSAGGPPATGAGGTSVPVGGVVAGVVVVLVVGGAAGTLRSRGRRER